MIHGTTAVNASASSSSSRPTSANVPDASSPSTNQHGGSTTSMPPVSAEFHVCDDDGTVAIRQDADGKVYTPSQPYAIGTGLFWFQFSLTLTLCKYKSSEF